MEKIAEHVKTRRVGNDTFTAKISYNGKNRLQGLVFSRKDGSKSGERLFIKDKEELASLRALFFKASCVLARRVPIDFEEEDT
jgi:hypothetical protein